MVLQIGTTALLVVLAIAIVLGILRTNRGPRKLHDLAARLAARLGGRVTRGPWGRPVVQIARGPIWLRIEWWRGQLGRNRRGPVTWITLGPIDPRAAPAYPEFLAVGRQRSGYETEVDLEHTDVRLGDPATDLALRIHANDPAALAAFLGPAARARMVANPEWETSAYIEGSSDEEDPAVSLLRVSIPGHIDDEAQLESALTLLGNLARR